MSNKLWIESSYFPDTPDFLFDNNGILVVPIFSPLNSVLLIIAFFVCLSLIAHQFNFLLVLASIFLSLAVSTAWAWRRRIGILRLSTEQLSKLKNVKIIQWETVSKIEVRGRRITLETTQGSHSSWVKGSAIPKLRHIIQSHPHVRFRVLKYRTKLLIVASILLAISFALAFVPIFLVVGIGYMGFFISVLFFIIFIARPKDAT